jgi:pimeloyl-ACP methyl ester carboxylesterase
MAHDNSMKDDASRQELPAAIVAAYEAQARRHETPCGDGSIVWRSWGAGPPLLLMHGSRGAWSHWIRNIDALSRHYTLWVPDLPGAGDSALPPVDDLDTMSDVLADGLRRLIGPALPIDAVGFSFGGGLTTWIAARHADLFRHIVIVDCGGLGCPKGDTSLERIRSLSGAQREAAHRTNLLRIMLHDPASVDPLALHLQERNGAMARMRGGTLLQPDRVITILPHVAARVSAIWGEKDQPLPHPAVQEAALRAVLPDMDFRVIPDAGHWVMYERPDAFHATLLAMLGTGRRD